MYYIAWLIIHRGYYTVARRYEFYVRTRQWQEKYFTSKPGERLRYCSVQREHKIHTFKLTCNVLLLFYNNPSYSRILIRSRLWSIRGQMHNWRHHYKVFPSAVLKWRKVLRIRIIFYVTRQKISYIKVLPRHWTGSRSKKTKDKAVSFRKWYRNNFCDNYQCQNNCWHTDWC